MNHTRAQAARTSELAKIVNLRHRPKYRLAYPQSSKILAFTYHFSKFRGYRLQIVLSTLMYREAHGSRSS